MYGQPVISQLHLYPQSSKLLGVLWVHQWKKSHAHHQNLPWTQPSIHLHPRKKKTCQLGIQKETIARSVSRNGSPEKQKGRRGYWRLWRGCRCESQPQSCCGMYSGQWRQTGGQDVSCLVLTPMRTCCRVIWPTSEPKSMTWSKSITPCTTVMEWVAVNCFWMILHLLACLNLLVLSILSSQLEESS